MLRTTEDSPPPSNLSFDESLKILYTTERKLRTEVTTDIVELRKAMTGHSNKTTEEISKLMPDDFNKKLREWEQLKVSKPHERYHSIISRQYNLFTIYLVEQRQAP